MKRILLSALIAMMLISLLSLCVLSTAAEEPQMGSCGENVNWTFDPATGELVISGQGAMTNYSITQTPPWFSSCGRITSVTVDEGVTALGSYAFLYCSNLSEITLPQSLTAIGSNTFSNCQRLTDIQLPANLQSMGMGAFQNCNAMKELRLPEGITEIPDSAFLGCSSLVSLKVPPQVTSIGAGAFVGCSDLKDISLPVGLTHIGKRAFAQCASLETLSIPHTVTELGDNLCAESALRTILFEGTQEEWNNVTLGSNNELLSDILLVHPGHLFDREIIDDRYRCTDATCESAASFYRSCACGEMGEETFSYGEPSGHKGGTATCQSQAICETCRQPYGILGDHVPTRIPDCLNGSDCSLCGIHLEDPLGHDHTPTVIPPTCTDAGFTTHVCSRCEDTYTDTPVDPLGHTEGAEATCTDDQFCTVCNALLTERLGHDHVPEITLAPTCTEEGVRTYTCSRCEDSYEETVDPTGHTGDGEATCTADQLCADCGTVLAERLGHEFVETVVDPTCEDQGYVAHVCSRCQYTYLDTFTPAKDHTPGAEATCTADQLCTDCGKVLTSKLGHQYTESVTEPTCEGQGYTTHTCSRCQHTYLDAFTPAKDHTPGAEATCHAPQTCTVCGFLLTEALNHDYRATIVESTCEGQGYIRHDCARCDATYLDSFTPARNHTPGAEATCRDPQACTVCGFTLVPPKGHTYTATVTAPTCTEAGYTTHTCSSCGIAYVDTPTSPIGHIPGAEATCMEAQTCTACHITLAPRLSHVYEESVSQTTCTVDGQVIHTCALCGDSYLHSTIPATGHTAGDWITDEQPDVGEPGRHHKACTVCGEVLESETFWETVIESDPAGTDANTDPFDRSEEGGCKISGGNIAVILLVVTAVCLLWFVRRK